MNQFGRVVLGYHACPLTSCFARWILVGVVFRACYFVGDGKQVSKKEIRRLMLVK